MGHTFSLADGVWKCADVRGLACILVLTTGHLVWYPGYCSQADRGGPPERAIRQALQRRACHTLGAGGGCDVYVCLYHKDRLSPTPGIGNRCDDKPRISRLAPRVFLTERLDAQAMRMTHAQAMRTMHAQAMRTTPKQGIHRRVRPVGHHL